MDPKQVSDRIQSQVGGYLSDFSGQSEPYKSVLSGPRKDSAVLHAAMDKIENGTVEVNDLGRAYKHTPHAPPAVFFKYITHRINNLDKYDTASSAHDSDHAFIRSIRKGGAAEQNHLVTARHLNTWLNLNPHIVENLLYHKADLDLSMRGVGVNIRKINSEPYVAMTRGLDESVMTDEMPLASFSDKRNSGFGSFQHHIWMPLSDLWYAFPLAPVPAWGEHGHENEYVFGNSKPRYQAENKDIAKSRFDEDTDTVSGPFGKVTPTDWFKNSSSEQLKEAVDRDPNTIYNIVRSPAFNESVGATVVAFADGSNTNLLPLVALSSSPCMALHKRLIEGLDKGPENKWLAGNMVANCFYAARSPESPTSFNNSQNTERYLRAIADYFTRFGEDAENPNDVYHKILSSGRMNDTLVHVLADMGRTLKNLPGMTVGGTHDLLKEMARWNEHLDQRQLAILASVPGVGGTMLFREGVVSGPVQEVIAKDGDGADLASLAYRADLSPKAADVILTRIKDWGSPRTIASLVAGNTRVPAATIEKHMHKDMNVDFGDALAYGLQSRAGHEVQDSIIKQLPAGGLE